MHHRAGPLLLASAAAAVLVFVVAAVLLSTTALAQQEEDGRIVFNTVSLSLSVQKNSLNTTIRMTYPNGTASRYAADVQMFSIKETGTSTARYVLRPLTYSMHLVNTSVLPNSEPPTTYRSAVAVVDPPLPNGASFGAEFAVVDGACDVRLGTGGDVVSISTPGAFKWTISVSDWPFANASNGLQVVMYFRTYNLTQDEVSLKLGDSGSLESVVIKPADANITWVITFSQLCIIDGADTTSPVSISPVPAFLYPTGGYYDEPEVYLVLTFPHMTRSLFYDPTLDVFFGDSGPNGGGSGGGDDKNRGGGGGGNSAAVGIGVGVGVGGAALIVLAVCAVVAVAAIGAAALAFRRHRSRSAVRHKIQSAAASGASSDANLVA